MSKTHYAPAVIGTTTDTAEREISINIDALVGSHAIAMANSGAGKTGLIRKVLESSHGQLQHIVLDVEDDFYTLREQFDYLVAGGENGDCPATVENAAELATMLLTHGISAIIQLNGLKAPEQEEFIRIFLEAMMAAPRALWRPLLLVLDEAQRLAPEKGNASCKAAMIDMLARGRKRGFTALLGTVRNSQISKDVTGMVNNWFMGRVGQATDRRVTADALGFSPNSADARGLQTMEPRTFWAFGPALAPVPVQFKVDRVKTTMLKSGEATVMSLPPPAAMKRLLAEMAKAAQKAQEAPKKGGGATTVAATPLPAAPGPSQEEIEAKVKAAYLAGVADGRTEGRKAAASTILAEVEKLAEEWARDIQGRPEEMIGVPAAPPPRRRAAAGLREVIADHAEDSSNVVALYEGPAYEGAFKPSGPQQKIIDAIASWQDVKPGPVDRLMLAFLADSSSKSSGYSNNLGAMRTAGIIIYPMGGHVDLTPDGRALAAPVRRKLTNDAVQRALMEKLEAPKRRILEALIEDWPEGVSKTKLAERIGVSDKSSGYSNNLGSMRSLGVIDYPAPGQVRASDDLFPFGRG